MKENIVREFKGFINGVEFDRTETYETIFVLLEELERKFNISINDNDKELIKDIMSFTVLATFDKHYSRNELLNATTNNIEAADKLEDVLFVSHKLDSSDNSWNREINKKVADPTKYTSIKNRIKNKEKETGDMKYSISHNFKGFINGVEFTHSEIYETTYFVLRELERKFKTPITDKDKELIEDVKSFVALAKFTERYSRGQLLTQTTNNIEAADKLEDVLFVSHKLDSGDNFWNSKINNKIADPTKYTSFKKRIKNKIKENSKPTLSISKTKENDGLER